MPENDLARLKTTRIKPALQEQILRLQSHADSYQWMTLYLESGRALVTMGGREFEVVAPAVLWTPFEETARFSVAAGSVGIYALLDDQMLGDAIGMVVESPDMRLFLQKPILASVRKNEDLNRQLEDLFLNLSTEANSQEFGSEVAASAYLRLLIITLQRIVGKDMVDHTTLGPQRALLSRFRNLVEAHFRSRWKVRRYAEELGMTYDRLHDLCEKSLGKAPSLLLRERSLHEAKMLLRRTSFSSEQISAMLGYSSASQFNHFFKSMTENSPGRYRREVLSIGENQTPETTLRFSDWP